MRAVHVPEEGALQVIGAGVCARVERDFVNAILAFGPNFANRAGERDLLLDCVNCGATVAASEAFCYRCGTPTGAAETSNAG